MKCLIIIFLFALTAVYLIKTSTIGFSLYSRQNLYEIKNISKPKHFPNGNVSVINPNRGKRNTYYIEKDSISAPDFYPFNYQVEKLHNEYQNDKNCRLMRSQYFSIETYDTIQRGLKEQYKFILADLERYLIYINNIQTKEIKDVFPTIPDFLNANKKGKIIKYVEYLDYIQKEIINLGYISRCSGKKNQIFCDDSKIFSKEIELVSKKIVTFFTKINLNPIEFFTDEFTRSLVKINSESSNANNGCTEIKNQKNDNKPATSIVWNKPRHSNGWRSAKHWNSANGKRKSKMRRRHK